MKFIKLLALFVINVALLATLLSFAWNTFLLPVAPSLLPLPLVHAYALSIAHGSMGLGYMIRFQEALKDQIPDDLFVGLAAALTKVIVLLILYVLSFFI